MRTMTKEKLVYRGKSKDVFEIAEGKYAGKYRMVFTDRAIGHIENEKPVFDPGYDVVVGEIPGKGAVPKQKGRFRGRENVLSCRPRGTRTPNRRFWRPMLYQLS